MTPPRPKRRRAALIGAITVVALLLAACAGDDAATDDAATDEAQSAEDTMDAGDDAAIEQEMAEEEMAEEQAADRDAAGGESGDGEAPGGDQPPSGDPDDRMVIRSAELVLEVSDSAAAAEEVRRIAEDAGGFVAETDLSRDDEGVIRGRLSLRVPSEELDATVDELDELGDAVPVRRVDEEDVTGEVTDLEARRDNLVAYERELTDLLGEVRDEGGDADQLVVVFDRLSQVRGEIEQLEARLASIEDQVRYSRVDVELVPTSEATPVSDPRWEPSDTLRDSLRDLSRALTTIADAAIRFGVTWLPIIVVIAVPVAVLALIVRAVRRRSDGDVEVAGSDGSVGPTQSND
ncbi:MAG: DUF4349 domain-containing protein [Nitriliruptoraceae bacterium]